MSNNIKGKVVVITGASSGLGEATAQLLSKEGAILVLAARRAERIEKLAYTIRENGGEALAAKKPYRINVSNAVRAGKNRLEIKVVNTWVNRLIGDAQPGVKQKITYTTMQFHEANSPLHPSGLLGPVKIVAAAK